MHRLGLAIVGLCCAATSLCAQQGDKPGEEQHDLPAELAVPAAPVLSADEALASFRVEPGFQVQLVAAEPLVEDPVAMAFDEDGRLLVVEMRGFMPDVDGRGELAPNGRIVRLVDVDGDGRMDRSEVLLDHLILPRAVAPAYGGFLVIEPPELNFYRDEDGDGRIDRMVHLLDGFAGLESPEHAGNGLLYGIDNWFHLSQHPLRLRFAGTALVTGRTPGHGQWGIARDDDGRIYYTTNSDPLRADLVPLHYAGRNPGLSALIGVNERVLDDFRVWPSRMTPGVNRGYKPETLTAEFKLASYTAACGPTIYRGDAFPAAYQGNAFLCEPSGFLIKRCELTEVDGDPVARVASEGREFLTSGDERFRPVNLTTGPDGALYIADMYRGILQHRVFITTFLRKQVLARGLDHPTGLGRIYRIVPDGYRQPPPTRLSGAADATLVAMLSHANGFWRDTAQRLLVERRARSAAPALRALVHAGDTPRATRLAALWSLAGSDALTRDDALFALAHDDPMVRIHGLRLAEPWIDEPSLLLRCAALADDPRPRVRVQAALSLGEGRSPAALELRLHLFTRHSAERAMRSALLSGLAGLEAACLDRLLHSADFATSGDGRDDVLKGIVGCILRQRDFEPLARLLELTASAPQPWQAELLANAIAADLRLDSERPRLLHIAREPQGLEPRSQRADPAGLLLARIAARLRWPGHDAVDELAWQWSDAERALRGRGEPLYAAVCASCHQPSGRGQPGVAPTLAGSPWVRGPPARLARILLHGMSGPLVVDDQPFNADMPRSAAPEDEQIAALLTYIRDAFGNNAAPVPAALIAEVRQQTLGRHLPWTAPELLGID